MTREELDQETIDASILLNRLFQEPLTNFIGKEKEVFNALMFLFPTKLVASYMISVIKNKNGYRQDWRNQTWTDTEGRQVPVCSYLFHANSVRTSLDYIRRKELYSRRSGAGGVQTDQRSDGLDRQLLIFNDIYFDNTDIPYVSGNYTSAYGPVMFVFDADIINDQDVRVTKVNPFSFKNSLSTVSYGDIFYLYIDQIAQEIKRVGAEDFIFDFGHHTTVFETETLPFNGNLKYIYIEKCFDNSGRETTVADRIRSELDSVGLNDVQISIRPELPAAFGGYAT